MKVSLYREIKPHFDLKINYQCFTYHAKKTDIKKGLPDDQSLLYILNNIENIYKKIKSQGNEALYKRLLLFKKGIVTGNIHPTTKFKVIRFIKNHIRPSLLRNNACFTTSRIYKYYLTFFYDKNKIKICAYYIDKSDQVLKISTPYIPMNREHVYYITLAYSHIVNISYRYILIDRPMDIRNCILYYFKSTHYVIKRYKEYAVILKVGKYNTPHLVYEMDIVHHNNDAFSLYGIPVCPASLQNIGPYKKRDKMYLEGLPPKVIDVVKSKDIMVILPDKIAVLYEDPFKITFVFEQNKKEFALSYYVQTADTYDYRKHDKIYSFVQHIQSTADSYIGFVLDNSAITIIAKNNKIAYNLDKKDTLCRTIKET